MFFFLPHNTTRQNTHNTKVEERKKEREQINVDAKRSSSSNLPKRRRYCTLLCFQGYFSLSLSLSLSLSVKILYKHVFITCLVQHGKSSTKKKNNEFHNTYRLLHSCEPFISFLSINIWFKITVSTFWVFVCHIICVIWCLPQLIYQKTFV